MKNYSGITLECSLKPFNDLSQAGIVKTCNLLYRNWSNLTDRANEVSILLWVSDGNEIFEWRGDENEELIWASSIGFCNYDHPDMDMFNPEIEHYRLNKAVPYCDNPQKITFKDLKNIIQTLKNTFHEHDKKVRIGATLDPGPEFADCRFKIERHPEILLKDHSHISLRMRFITHQAILNQDNESYASYPNGIPKDTSFGTFLGKQFESCCSDLGYDYIWFSNGFAYSHFPWDYKGESFDGENFSEKIAEKQNQLLSNFWKDFRQGCPIRDIETRGTNFSVGNDISAHGASHRTVRNEGYPLCPPCNPPWGSRALGLEMSSHLSRIAKLATPEFMFRFYINDPWFSATPWQDYYGKEPFDIYCPTTVGRIQNDGSLQSATRLSLLTVDSEKGELSPTQSIEVTPHLIQALDEMPDNAGPVIWIYPDDEYHDCLEKGEGSLNELFMGDWFITQAISSGLPLNTVISSDVFVELYSRKSLPMATYICPAPHQNWEIASIIEQAPQQNIDIILYGPLTHCSKELRTLLSVDLSETGLDGDFEVENTLQLDHFDEEPKEVHGLDPTTASLGYDAETYEKATNNNLSERPLTHYSNSGGGKIHEVFIQGESEALVNISQKSQVRIYSTTRKPKHETEGRISWIRGSVHFDTSNLKAQEIISDPAYKVILCSDWTRHILGLYGWDIQQQRNSENTLPANLFIKRVQNAFWFTGHKQDATVTTNINTPYGAPIYNETQTKIIDGYSFDTWGRSFNSEVRGFVTFADSNAKSIISCKEIAPGYGANRQLCYSGLLDATLTFFAPEGAKVTFKKALYATDSLSTEKGKDKGSYILRNFSGTLFVRW